MDLATLIILTKKESYFLKKISQGRGERGGQGSVKSDSLSGVYVIGTVSINLSNLIGHHLH